MFFIENESKATYSSISEKVRHRMIINILKLLKDRSMTIDKLTQVMYTVSYSMFILKYL